MESEDEYSRARKEKEAESIENEVEESEEEEPKEDKKVAIVKFLLEKADAQTTEKVRIRSELHSFSYHSRMSISFR